MDRAAIFFYQKKHLPEYAIVLFIQIFIYLSMVCQDNAFKLFYHDLPFARIS
jgi:hypothetical protein